jgi:hypothetical protein
MEIRLTPLIYVISLVLSAWQTTYTVQMLYKQRKREQKSASRAHKLDQMITSCLLLSLAVFNIHNICGIFIGYSQTFVRYRSVSRFFHERFLQVIELLLDSTQKSTVLLSAVLFLPILNDIHHYFGDARPSKSFQSFVMLLSFLRIIVYPSVYITLSSNVNAALYFIDVLNIAESFFLMYIFISIYFRYNNVLETEKTGCSFVRMVFESKVEDLRSVLVLLPLQLFLDISYKATIIVVSLVEKSTLEYITLDSVYLMRLASLSLQMYCILKICLAEDFACIEESFCQKTDVKSNCDNASEIEGKLGLASCHYFAQPNKGREGEKGGKRFTLF